MTRLLRAGVLLAFCAALLGAPSVVLAAGPPLPDSTLPTPGPAPLSDDTVPPSSPIAMPVDDGPTPSQSPLAMPSAPPPAATASPATAPVAAPSTGEASGDPSPDAKAAATDVPQPVAGGGNPAAAPASDEGSHPVAHAGGASDLASPAMASPSGRAGGTVVPNAAPPMFGELGTPWWLPALIASAVAILAIGGVAWLLLGRRRQDEEQLLGAGADHQAGSQSVNELIAGRAVRRSRLDPSDDPIVAAMNLPPRKATPGNATTPRFRTGQVSSGPGERPIEARRRRRGR